MQQYAYSDSSANLFNRAGLVKISRVSGTSNRYVIRLMLNNLLTFYFSSSEVLTKTIPSDDADVAAADTFYILYSSSGYQIRPYGKTNVLAANVTTASGAGGAPDSYLINATVSAAGNQGRWQLHQYTGYDQKGYTLSASPSITYGMTKGKSYTVEVCPWSTVINGQQTSLVANTGYTDRVSITALSTTYRARFRVNALKIGQLRMTLYVKDSEGNGAGTYLLPYVIEPDISENQPVYIQNLGTDKYVDIEGPSTANHAIIQQWKFNRSPQSQWIFERTTIGFYRIKSVYSGKYIGVDPSDMTTIRQYDTESNYTHWYFEQLSTYRFRIVCKADSSKTLMAPSTASIDGANLLLGTYTADTALNDEWYIIGATYTILNLYDKSIPNDSMYLGGMEAANEYLATVFKNYFNMDFVYADTVYWSDSPVNDCDILNTCCDNICATDCVNHHKNIDTLFTQMRNYRGENRLAHNQILVTWMDQIPNAYCRKTDGVHDRNTGGIAFTPLNDPYIQVLTVDGLQVHGDLPDGVPPEFRYIAPMTTVLIHEMVHCFGFEDVYHQSYHEPYNGSCVMGYFDAQNELDMFLDYFYVDEGEKRIDLFCPSCIEAITEKTLMNPFKLNSYVNY